MIVNPTSYSFTPPVNMTPVTGFVMTLRQHTNANAFVSEYFLSSTEFGGDFSVIRSQLLAASYAGVELNMIVQSLSGSVRSLVADGNTTFSFQPTPDPPSNVVIQA